MKRFAQNHQFYILVTFLMVMSSCVKEMDFNGVKDITLEPQMQIELLKAEITQEDMVAIFEDNLPPSSPKPGYIPFTDQSFSLPKPIVKPISLTSEERILKYLVDGEGDETEAATPVLNFKFTNSTKCEFNFTIQLLDKDKNDINISETNGDGIIEASTGGEVVDSVSYSYKAEDFKRAAFIKIDIEEMTPKEDLYPDPNKSLAINANGIFNFSYDTSEGLP